MANKHLLVNEIDGEDQRSQRGINQSDCFTRNEYGHNSKNHQNDDCHKEDTAHHSEIPFRLERKQCETQANSSRDTNSQ